MIYCCAILGKSYCVSEITLPFNMEVFLGFKDQLHLHTESQIEFFGTVVLGLESGKVKQSIVGIRKLIEPSKAAADLLERWVEHKPESTAQDMLTAMEKARFSKQVICRFTDFLKVQKYETGMSECLNIKVA